MDKTQMSQRLIGVLFYFIFLMLLVGCQRSSEAGPPSSYETYNSDGISISYPQHWSFSYDDSPSLYSSRGIAFSVSEFSGVSVLVESDQETTTKDILDGFISRLNNGRDPMLKEVERESVEISGHEGEALRWVDTLVNRSDRELTIVKVYDQPLDVYAVFNLTNDDIEAVEAHMPKFVEGIVLKSKWRDSEMANAQEAYDGRLISELGAKRYLKAVADVKTANINFFIREEQANIAWRKPDFGCHGPAYGSPRQPSNYPEVLHGRN